MPSKVYAIKSLSHRFQRRHISKLQLFQTASRDYLTGLWSFLKIIPLFSSYLCIKIRDATIFVVFTAKAVFIAALPHPEHVSVWWLQQHAP
jgi:hypothetical protein